MAAKVAKKPAKKTAKKPAKKAGAKPALGKNGKPKKKRRAKDPNKDKRFIKPKRFISAYIYFSNGQRAEVHKRQPELKVADVSKLEEGDEGVPRFCH